MLNKFVVVVFSIMCSAIALADELKLNENAPKTYVVKKGDTLWDISEVFLNQPWLWPKLWRLNPEVNNPHLIYPGDVLRLVFDEQGRPMLVKGKPELKWTPKVRTQLKDLSPISTLPLHVIAPYIKYDSLLTDEQIEKLPYVLGSEDGYKSSLDHIKVYVNGDLTVGQSYAVYEQGDEITDPETQEVLGRHVILVGSGKAVASGNKEASEPATLYLDGVKREVRAGTIVVPVNDGQLFPSYFTMQAANASVRGAIIKSAIDVREFGKLDIVMINRGLEHSVKQGDVMMVKRTSPSVIETGSGPVYTEDASKWNRLGGNDSSDYKMPEEPIGEMMVFKVYEQVSLALVLSSRKPLRLEDIIASPR
ncbi:LysM peptidoglycan-binding domain-containing protein [Thalassotalea sp. PLHSN55]|uniref:LysM peptidoglycan-binding domain-containing protein n=1 Tax=Thalassotalea sp. PLHSN55 TaxID=3435888 RepID=UPI003F8583EB